MNNDHIKNAVQNMKTVKERSSGKIVSEAEALLFIQAEASLALAIELNRLNNNFEDQMKIGGALDFRRH